MFTGRSERPAGGRAVKLFAPEYYWRLSEDAKKQIGGGCGPGGTGDFFVPDTLWGLSVRSACHIHDVMYHFETDIGGKELADRVFLNNMLRIIYASPAPSWLKWLRRRRARTYYLAVKWFAAPFYWRNKNLETEEMEVVLA